MKIKCMKRNLLKAVRMVKKAIRKTTSVYTEAVFLKTENDYLELTTNNMTSGIQTRTLVEVLEVGDCCVYCEQLEKVLDLMPEREDIVLETKGSELLVRSGSVKMKLCTMDTEKFNSLKSEEDDAVEFELSECLFREIVRDVMFAASNDRQDKKMASIFLHIQDNELSLTALDGHRIARRNIKINTHGEKAKCMIEYKELVNIVSLFSDDLMNVMHLRIGKNSFVIQNKEIYASGQIVDGEYFAIDKFMDIANAPIQTTVMIEKEELEQALLRCEYAIDSTKPMILEIGKTLKMTADSNRASIDEEIAANITGTELKIGMNPKYLRDIIKVYPGDSVKIEFINAKSPIYIFKDGYFYLLLPVNIK